MIENGGESQQAAAEQVIPNAQPSPPKKIGGIPRTAWLVGCGCLLLLSVALAVTAVIFGGPYLFARDQIASVAPNDSLAYMSIDLLKSQTEEFNHIVSILQKISDSKKSQTAIEALDEQMLDEFDLSFSDDVLPWMGRHASMVITEGNLNTNDVKFMFIFEVKNKGKADKFITKFVTALHDKKSMSFEQKEKDGLVLQVSGAGTDRMVIARSGKLLYLANSEDAILDSVNLKSSDSLSNSDAYNTVLKMLPKDRLSTVYIGGPGFKQLISDTMTNSGVYQTSPVFTSQSIEALGLSATVTKVGLQMDFAALYDKEKMTDYEKRIMSLAYLPPTADTLVPENTFVFMGTNISKNLESPTQTENPMFTPDMRESFDLFEKEYGIRLADLVDLLGGEFALAMAPADGGLLKDTSNLNLGITMIASTENEQGFMDWAENVLDVASQQMGIPFKTDKAAIGGYSLQQVKIDNGSGQTTALIYGADQGYIFLGTSQDMLKKGLDGGNTLAANVVYQKAWDAFSPDSVPYIYINVRGLIDVVAEGMGSADSDTADWRDKLDEIGVVAVARNQASDDSQSATMIIFIENTP